MLKVMEKPSAKGRKGTPTLSSKKSSWSLVDASTGKTIPRTQGVAIGKNSNITYSQSLSTHNNVPKTIKTHSSSVKHVAIASKVGSKSGDGVASMTNWISHSRKISKAKVVGCKFLDSTPRFPPLSPRRQWGGKVDTMEKQTIRKPARFSQQDSSIPDQLLGSSGPGDHGKAAPKVVQQKQVHVHLLSPMDLDESNMSSAANDVLLDDSLDETDWSPPTPCNSSDALPTQQAECRQDDNMVELEASQMNLMSWTGINPLKCL